MKHSARWTAYSAFLVFCLLSALRDVSVEYLIRSNSLKLDGIFFLWAFSGISCVISGLRVASSGHRLEFLRVTKRTAAANIIWLIVFTFISFTCYFLAIQSSSVGAAGNSLVDYGMSPVFTAVAGALLLKERLDVRFSISLVLGILGISLFASSRVGGEQAEISFSLGILLALIGSAASAIYHVYFKRLIGDGIRNDELLLIRLFPMFLILSIVTLGRVSWTSTEVLLSVVAIGILGFYVPLYLLLFVIAKVELKHLALMLFLLPVLTVALSAGFGLADFGARDGLAAGCLFGALAVFEAGKRET